MGSNYEPSGEVYFWVPTKSGLEHLVSIRFVDRDELRAAFSHAKAYGWRAFSEGKQQKQISPTDYYAPPNGSDKPVCPKHGIIRMREDNGGKGWYCSAKTQDGFCGWQSWKSKG